MIVVKYDKEMNRLYPADCYRLLINITSNVNLDGFHVKRPCTTFDIIRKSLVMISVAIYRVLNELTDLRLSKQIVR